MTKLDEILAKLEGVKKVNGNYAARCPAHEDRLPSLSIKESEGKVLMFCHAGCSYLSIAEALGITRSVASVGERQEVAHYNYTDEAGKIVLQVVRYEPKGFSQRRPEGDGWVNDTKNVRAPLYNLPAVLEKKKVGGYVIFVEGEKDCETLRINDVTATSIRGGSSGKWHEDFTKTLEGAKVAIIPDNDEPGKKHALRVADSIYGWAQSVRILELPGQEKGDDVTDWFFREGNDRIALARVLEKTPEYTPPQIVSREEFNSLRHLVRSQAADIKYLRWKINNKPSGRNDGV